MEEQLMQMQINDINRKLDDVLEYLKNQNAQTSSVQDMMSDISIVATDIYHTAVSELDNRAVEINPEEVKLLMIRLVKNVKNFNELLQMLESTLDFMRDAGPIANEVIIEITHKLAEFEQKGYFIYLNQISRMIDNVVTHFKPEDISLLADNVVNILETVKNITQPEMLNAVNTAVKVFNNLETENPPEYSMWQVYKEMRTPEMRRGMGMMISFMKNMSQKNV
jgi:uncharacterized protein YjgD (DUF1641 family)